MTMVMTEVEASGGFVEAEKPLLFMRMAVLGGTPWDFTDKLAEHYNADQVAPDEIRMDLCGVDEDDPATYQRINFRDSMNGQVYQAAGDQVREGLAAGHNIVYEGFVNAERSQQRFVSIAEEAGALAVIMRVRCRAAKMTERIAQGGRNDLLPMPVPLYGEQGPLEIASQMLTQIEGVMPAFPHVIIDGGIDDTRILIADVDRYVNILRTN